MVKTLLFLSFILISACGKQVDISNEKLQSNSSLSDGTNTAVDKDGLIIRGTPDKIVYANTTYQVSMYSSYQALEFIAARPLNTQYSVRFRGTPKTGQMVLEYVQAK